MIDVIQLFDKETGTYTYVVFDNQSKDAIVIDSVKGNAERDIKELQELGLHVRFVLDTHVHADHVTGAFDIAKATGAKIVAGKGAGEVKHVDIFLDDNQELDVGSFTIRAISTPGHTDSCTTYSVEKYLFTGDTLLIRSVGRTDFQAGSPEKLFESIHKLYAFPDDTTIYPAHNYAGLTRTTVKEEKEFNNFIKQRTQKTDFVQAMNARELPLPKYIKIAVPSNMISGEHVVEE